MLNAVDWLRGWYDDFGDKEYDAIQESLVKVIGEEKLEELES